MIKATHAYTANCSPIKPHSNPAFGRNEVMDATADWLQDIQDGDISEGKFNGLNKVAEKMHDGPLKTFVKILAIGGGAFAATKVGSAKIINTITKNDAIADAFITPLTKFVHNSIETLSSKLKSNQHFGEGKKGVKPFVVNNLSEFVGKVKLYGKRGVSSVEDLINAKINDYKNISEDLSEVDKLSYTKKIDALTERKKYAATENLLTKVTTNTAGAGAGTVAIVEANRDKDGNGIPDIGEHEVA